MNTKTYSLLKWSIALCISVIFAAFVGTVWSHNADAAAGINKQINFQGRLLNAQGATVPDGYYNIQFKIYQDGDGQTVGNTTGTPAGSLKWTENYLNSAGKGVQVKNGFLSVQLGSVTAFGTSIDWDQDTLWLSMNVGNTNATCTPFSSCAPDGEMVPMKRMSSSPYAVNSGMLGGKTGEQFIQLAQGVQTDVSTNTNSIFINKTGTGGSIIKLQQAGTDQFTISNTGNLLFGGGINHTIGIDLPGGGLAGRGLTISAGQGGVGGGGTAVIGGTLTLQGGNAGNTSNANGGDVVINAGTANGTGTNGIVRIGSATTSSVEVGNSGSATFVRLGNSTGAVSQSIAIGTNATAGSSTSITLGSSVGTSSTSINAGSGAINLLQNTTIASGRNLTLGAACSTGQFLSTDAGAVVACQTATTGVTSVGTINSQTKSGNGAVIVGSTIYLQSADASNPGLIDTSAQTLAGAKTFTSGLTVNTAAGFTGNLVNLSVNNSSKFSVSETGNSAVAGTFTATSTINTTSGAYQIGGSNVLSSSALSFSGATANSITSTNNQSLSITAGNATTPGANGSNLNLNGGSGNGAGVKGLVNIGPSAQAAVTNASCSANCTITQANVDGYGTVVISASTSSIIITLPPPTITSLAGRTVYVTTASGSQDFTLRTNSGSDLIDVAMRQNTTSTMIWNGTAWTPGGASNATTLQATYNNGSNPATTPEIKLDTIRGTIDIQDADTSIGADLFNIRGSNPGGLGTVLFGVGDTGRVTIQGTSDQNSAFRVLGSNGDYLFNINSSNSYIISNATRAPGNEIQNPGLESGGLIVSGEEGWFGPAIASISNDSANAKSGNYLLEVTANSSNTDVYAGKYYEVTAGDSIYFEGWVKNSAGAPGDAGIEIIWYNKDKSILSSSTAYPNNPGTTYVLRTINATAPAGSQYARVAATVRANATSGTFYFDNFYMKRSLENASVTFRNSVDSSAAFRIQSAGSAQTLFTADTTSNTLKVGDSTGTGSSTTVLVLDSATANPTTLTGLNGGVFYRSDTNSLKAIIGGSVVDICTTAVTCSGYSASSGSAVSLQGSTPGTAQIGNFNITGTGILTQLQTQDQTASFTSTQNLTIRTGNAAGSNSNSGSLILDVGTATGTTGTITIGHAGVSSFMPGNLSIQGSNSLALGTSSSETGSILFKTAAGANTITLRAPASNPTASYVLTLPTQLGGSGDCIKTDTSGNMYFQGCGVGVNFNLQDAYNNSNAPADITLADGKSLQFTAQDTAGTDPSVLVNLQCITGCSSTSGRFAVQNSGTDVFRVSANGNGIMLGAYTQVGSSITDSTQVNFQLDSYNGSSDVGACSTSVNQGVLYYNTNMGSIRSCINGSWSDVSNPDTLGLLTFGIVPSSGSQPYDLPALVTSGYSGPCKVSWASNTTIHIEPCTAYSNGRRLTVAATTLSTNSATTSNTNLTTTARWGHVCLNPTSGQPEFTATTGTATPTANMPTFSAVAPILCLADVVGSATTAGQIDDIYDIRTFTSAMKEAVNLSAATQLGMIVDASTSGAMTPAVSSSAKLYGTVVATNGATSAGAPNAIVTTVGPAWVKATAGTAGQFIKTSTTDGFGNTTAAIPNNSFYYSVGNTRTSYSTACTSAATCNGSLYVNFIVR